MTDREGPPDFTDELFGSPTLLLGALAALTPAVAGVWLVAATGAAWAVGLTVLAAVGGAAGLLALVSHQMNDGDRS
jgi:hypothetical protein